MRKITFLFLISIFSTFFTGVVFAQENTAEIIKKQEVTVKDLGVSNPGMLPGNPFYFLKEWGREVKKNFAFDAVKKAEVQLQIVNERAAEIKKLKELLPSSAKTFTKSLDNYAKSIETLQEKIEALKGASSSDTNEFLNQLADSVIKHIKLFSEIKSGVGDKNSQKISELQERITEILAEIPSKIETPIDFKCRLENVIKGQDENLLKEITISEVLDRFDEKLSKETRLELLKIKENLLIKLQSKLQSEDFSLALSEILNQLSGDSVRKIKILDEIREGVSASDIKTKLNLARQDILDRAVETKEIRSAEAEKMIEDADSLLSDLQESISATSTPRSAIINSLFTKAKFNLDQAKQAFESDNYGQAFGQASASSAAASTGLNYISKFNTDSTSCGQDDLNIIKEYYDEVIVKIKDLGLTKDDFPDIFELVLKSEKSIAKISDLVKKNTKLDTLIPLYKDSKLILSQIDNDLIGIMNSKKAD